MIFKYERRTGGDVASARSDRFKAPLHDDFSDSLFNVHPERVFLPFATIEPDLYHFACRIDGEPDRHLSFKVGGLAFERPVAVLHLVLVSHDNL